MARSRTPDAMAPVELSTREAEEFYDVTPGILHQRLDGLLSSRWPELLHEDTPVGRRARTLGTCASLREARQLAEFAHRSEEQDLPQSRGEKMLPDVAKEAKTLLEQDRCLKLRPALRDALREALPSPHNDEGGTTQKLSRRDLERYSSLLRYAEDEYLDLCRQSMISQFNDTGSLVEFEEAIEQLASHARSIGWSDDGLIALWDEVAAASTDPVDRVTALCAPLPANIA